MYAFCVKCTQSVHIENSKRRQITRENETVDLKRRMTSTDELQLPSVAAEDSDEFSRPFETSSPLPPSVDGVMDGLNADDDDQIASHVITVYHLIGRDTSSIDEFIELGITAKLLDLLAQDKRPHIQLSAVKVLYKILHGTADHLDAVVESGVCSQFVYLVDNGREDVAREVTWCLSLVALKRPQLRESLIELGIAPALTRLLKASSTDSARLAVSQCVNNLTTCDSAAVVPQSVIVACLPTIRELLTFNYDVLLVGVCANILRILDESGYDFASEFLEYKVVAKLGEALCFRPYNRTVVMMVLQTIDLILDETMLEDETSDEEGTKIRSNAQPVSDRFTERTRLVWRELAKRGVIFELIDLTKLHDTQILPLAQKLITQYRVAEDRGANDEYFSLSHLYHTATTFGRDEQTTSSEHWTGHLIAAVMAYWCFVTIWNLIWG